MEVGKWEDQRGKREYYNKEKKVSEHASLFSYEHPLYRKVHYLKRTSPQPEPLIIYSFAMPGNKMSIQR